MSPTKTDTLKVPGATLHYEVRGQGPVLLMICGGLMDAAVYEGIAAPLADAYTVITYDRRGNSRSPLDGPREEQRVEVHADDAYRLVEAIGGGPARVFGNSSGAVIGLDLAARYPGHVHTLVAHEPVVFELLPDREHWRTVLGEVHETYGRYGAGAAMGRLGAALGMGDDGPQGDPTPETQRIMGNLDAFVGYETSRSAGTRRTSRPCAAPASSWPPGTPRRASRRSAPPSPWPSDSARRSWSSPATTAGSTAGRRSSRGPCAPHCKARKILQGTRSSLCARG